MDPKDERMKEIIELTRQIYNCASCRQLIVGDYFVIDKFSYHQACFNCNKCGGNMAKAYHKVGERYCCPNCYVSLLPICGGCKKPIDSTTCVKAEDINWHFDCFVCNECRKPFKEGRYYLFEKQQFCLEHLWAKKEAAGHAIRTIPDQV